jgi:hypothetical protein
MGSAKYTFVSRSIVLQLALLFLSANLACVLLACSKPGASPPEAEKSSNPAARVEMIKEKRDTIAKGAREQTSRESGSKIPRGTPFIVVDGKKLCYLDREKLKSLPQVEFEGKREGAVAVRLIDLLNDAGIKSPEKVAFSNFVEQNLLSVPWRDLEARPDAFIFVLNRANISLLRYEAAESDEPLLLTVRVKKIAVSTR